jgi:hypothetical protein
MHKTILSIVTVSLVVLLTFQYSDVQTNIIQPQAERTGAPQELTCGDQVACHNVTPNTGSGNVSIVFNGGNNEYVPGNTYEVAITVSEAGITKFGFECTSIDANGDSAGLWLAAVQGAIAYPLFPNTLHRRYVSHHNADATNSWVVNWKAPVADKGPLTFYAAGNAANGNLLATGDHIYTSSLTILPIIDGISNVDGTQTPFVIQNPVHDDLNIQYGLDANENITISLYDLKGTLIRILYDQDEVTGFHARSFDISEIAAGLYLVQLKSGNIHYTEKIIVD